MATSNMSSLFAHTHRLQSLSYYVLRIPTENAGKGVLGVCAPANSPSSGSAAGLGISIAAGVFAVGDTCNTTRRPFHSHTILFPSPPLPPPLPLPPSPSFPWLTVPLTAMRRHPLRPRSWYILKFRGEGSGGICPAKMKGRPNQLFCRVAQ